MGKIYEYIRGYYTVRASENGARHAMNLLMENAVPFYNVKTEQDGMTSFRLDGKSFRKYLSLTDGHVIDGESVERSGLFSVALKYKMRVGFFAGALLFAAIIAASSLFIWDINIMGEVTVSEDEVMEVLRDHGVYIGAYIPNVNTAEAEVRLVIALNELSSASVNLRGTVAEVIVREETAKDGVGLSSPSNIVAARDGMIETIEVMGGIPTVKRGQIVKEGQILVSGVIDSQAVGYRLVRSRGNVYARTTMQYSETVPLKYDEKEMTGQEKTFKSIKFFSKKINLFSNNEISFEKYDTIEEEKRICLFGKIELPVFICTKTYAEYRFAQTELTEEQAAEKAYDNILKKSENDLKDAQILNRYTSKELIDGAVVVKCDVECIADIAKEVIIQEK